MTHGLKNFPAVRRVAADRSLSGEPLRVALLKALTDHDLGVVGVLACRVVCDMAVTETQLRVFADHFALSAMIGSDDPSEDAPRLAAVGRALGLPQGEAESAMEALGPALRRAGIEVAA